MYTGSRNINDVSDLLKVESYTEPYTIPAEQLSFNMLNDRQKLNFVNLMLWNKMLQEGSAIEGLDEDSSIIRQQFSAMKYKRYRKELENNMKNKN